MAEKEKHNKELKTIEDLPVRSEEKRNENLASYIKERRQKQFSRCHHSSSKAPPMAKDVEFPVDVNVVLSCGLDIKDKDVIEVGWPLKGKKIQTTLRYEDGKFWTKDKDFLDVHGAAYGISMENLREVMKKVQVDFKSNQKIWTQIHNLEDKLREQRELPKGYADVVGKFEANSAMVTAFRKEVAALYTEFPKHSTVKGMKERIDGIFSQYKLHQSRVREDIQNLRNTMKNQKTCLDGILTRMSKIEKPCFEEGLEILKGGKNKKVPSLPLADIEIGGGDTDQGFTVPTTLPRTGDHLVFNGKEWVCAAPQVTKPTPKVWLGPRMLLGAILFSPAMLLGPLVVMVTRIGVAATIPSKAHKIPGFRKTLKGFARFVFKEDMSWKHLLAFGPIATAETFAVVEAVNYFGLTLPW